jgi:hypothetical protein
MARRARARCSTTAQVLTASTDSTIQSMVCMCSENALGRHGRAHLCLAAAAMILGGFQAVFTSSACACRRRRHHFVPCPARRVHVAHPASHPAHLSQSCQGRCMQRMSRRRSSLVTFHGLITEFQFYPQLPRLVTRPGMSCKVCAVETYMGGCA